MGYVFLIIIAILVFVGFKTTYPPPPPPPRPDPYLLQSFRSIDSFLKRCYNEETLEFDWHTYNHDDKDIMEDEKSQRYLYSQMKSIGYGQCNGLSTILYVGLSYPDSVPAKLRDKVNAITNLTNMFGGDSACPQYVKQFKLDLDRLAYGKMPATRQNIQMVLNRYDAGRANDR